MSQTLPPQAPIPDLGPSTRRRRKKRPSLLLRRVIAVGVLVAGAAMLGGGFGALSRALFKPIPSATAPASASHRINTLVVAVNPKPLAPEPGEKATRRVADGLYLLSLDTERHEGFVLSMPRQTRALLGTNGGGQLGDALAYGGVPLLRETVEGVTGLQVDHYVWLELDGAKTILGQLGKPEVYVAKPVQFTDPASGTQVDLQPGWQQLSPEGAIAFGLLRPDDVGLDHIVRQQFLMHQLQSQINGQFAWWWFGGAVSKAVPALTTDLPNRDFETLANTLREVSPDAMRYATLPGEVSKAGDWLVSAKRYDSLLTKLQTPIGEKSVSELKPTIEIVYDAASESKEEAAAQKADERVLQLATRLTEQGFQVVRTARGSVHAADTRVIDRARADLRSTAVLGALDAAVGDAMVEIEPEEIAGYGAQYTLELGKRFFK
jgi:LCP family protein required for cell wall assembly